MSRKEAEQSIQAINVLQATTRCPQGWKRVEQLRVLAEQYAQSGNVDTARETYKAVTEHAAHIQSYLSQMETVEYGKQQRVISERRMIEASIQAAKSGYNTWRTFFNTNLSTLELGARRGYPVDWKELRSIDATAASLAEAGRWEEAQDAVIDGNNLASKMIDTMTGRRPTPPTPKPPRGGGTSLLPDIPNMGVDTSVCSN